MLWLILLGAAVVYVIASANELCLVDNKNLYWLVLGLVAGIFIIAGSTGLVLSSIGCPVTNPLSYDSDVVYESLGQTPVDGKYWVILRNIGNGEERLFEMKEGLSGDSRYFKYNPDTKKLDPYQFSK